MSAEPHLQAVPTETWAGQQPEDPAPSTGTTPGAGAGASGSTPTGSDNGSRDRAVQKQRPTLSLPTDRMKFDKQVETLRLFAQLSGPNKQPVSAEDLGTTLGMHPNTAGLCSGFFTESGWTTKLGRGAYSATDALLEYNRHLAIDPDDQAGALPHLRSTAQTSWYWETIAPLLSGGPTRQAVLLLSLSKTSGAHDHKGQLLLVLDWLEWLGLLRRDGELYTSALGQPSVTAEQTEQTQAPQMFGETEQMQTPAAPAAGAGAQVPTAQVEAPIVDEAVQSLISFNLSVRITADDAARLTPEQLTSLLQVVEKLRG